MSTEPKDPFQAEDFRATASAYSQLAGVLGGFCMTILVLVLSPDFLKDNDQAKDWVTGLLLLATLAYVLASSFLANSMNSLTFKSVQARRRYFDVGINVSNLAHILLSVTLAILVYQFSSTVGIIAIVIIVVIVVLNALVNLGYEFGVMRTRS